MQRQYRAVQDPQQSARTDSVAGVVRVKYRERPEYIPLLLNPAGGEGLQVIREKKRRTVWGEKHEKNKAANGLEPQWVRDLRCLWCAGK